MLEDAGDRPSIAGVENCSFDADGAPIEVDEQIAGFLEWLQERLERTGGPIAPVDRPRNSVRAVGSAPMASQLTTQHVREVIRIAELAAGGQLVGHTFIDCHILGPAVLAPSADVRFSSSRFDGPNAESILWEVDPIRPLVGALVLHDSRFDRCRFENIGLVIPRGRLQEFAQVLASGRPPPPEA